MNSKTFLVIALFLAILVTAPGAAASSIYNLNVNNGCCGSGPYGTVQLTQNGSKEVDFLVSLNSGFDFVLAGFGFDLTIGGFGTPIVTVSQPSINAGFSSNAAGFPNFQAIPMGGFGNFNYIIGTQGTLQPIGQPLSFSVTDSSGISISNFLINSTGGDKASYFVADILCTGCTSHQSGFVGSDGVASTGSNVAAAPEPEPLLISALGLLMFAMLRFKRTSK
jgi:hypothetical protein